MEEEEEDGGRKFTRRPGEHHHTALCTANATVLLVVSILDFFVVFFSLVFFYISIFSFFFIFFLFKRRLKKKKFGSGWECAGFLTGSRLLYNISSVFFFSTFYLFLFSKISSKKRRSERKGWNNSGRRNAHPSIIVCFSKIKVLLFISPSLVCLLLPEKPSLLLIQLYNNVGSGHDKSSHSIKIFESWACSCRFAPLFSFCFFSRSLFWW